MITPTLVSLGTEEGTLIQASTVTVLVRPMLPLCPTCTRSSVPSKFRALLVSIPQLSEISGWGKLTEASHIPLPVLTIIFSGQLIWAGVLSATVTVKEQVAV